MKLFLVTFQIGDKVKVIKRLDFFGREEKNGDFLGEIAIIKYSYAQAFRRYDVKELTIDKFNSLEDYHKEEFNSYHLIFEKTECAWFKAEELEKIKE